MGLECALSVRVEGRSAGFRVVASGRPKMRRCRTASSGGVRIQAKWGMNGWVGFNFFGVEGFSEFRVLEFVEAFSLRLLTSDISLCIFAAAYPKT